MSAGSRSAGRYARPGGVSERSKAGCSVDVTDYPVRLSECPKLLAYGRIWVAKSSEYEVGDRIVYPRRGAGTITGITRMELVDGFHSYYVIDLPAEKLTVHVPSRMVDKLGVRPVVSRGRVDTVLDKLSQPADLLPDNYKERQAGVREQLATGLAMPIAEAIRDLNGHEQRAHLTKVDKDLLAEGREFLAEELALATDTDVVDAQMLIDQALESTNGEEPADSYKTAT